MGIDKREFVPEFTKFWYPGQARTSESLHESFFNSHHVLVKREQELHES